MEEKIKDLLEFAQKYVDYCEQESADDPEEWFIPLYEFCQEFIEIFKNA